jgi:PAS domain S-box-containing protein
MYRTAMYRTGKGSTAKSQLRLAFWRKLIASVLGGAVGLLGIIGLHSWYFDSALFSVFDSSFSSMGLVSAMLFSLAGAGLYSYGFDAIGRTRVIGGLICLISALFIVSTIVPEDIWLRIHAAWLNGLFEQSDISSFVRQNKAAAFLLIGIALFSVEGLEKFNGTIILTSVLGLVVFALGALSVLGYAVNAGDVTDWQPFARVSLSGALAFMAIGVSLVILPWLRDDIERASFQVLGKAISVFTAAGVFTVALVSAGFGVLGLQESVYLASKSQLQQLLVRKSLVLDNYISKYKLLAAHVSNNPDAVELLTKLDKKLVPPGVYRQQVGSSLAYVSSLNREILGIVRYDRNDMLVAGAGMFADLAQDFHEFSAADAFKVGGPYLRPPTFYFVASSPVYDAQHVRTGTDFFILDGKIITDILSQSAEFGRSARLYLSALHHSNREVFGFFDDSLSKLESKIVEFQTTAPGSTLSNPDDDVDDVGDPDETESAVVAADKLGFHASTSQAPWRLTLEIDPSELRARSQSKIRRSVAAASLLALCCACALVFISRRLIKRTLVLQEELVLTGDSLALEAARRRLAEKLAIRHEQESQAIIERAKDGIISIYCSDATIRSFGPAAEEIFGYTEEELIGTRIDTLLPALGAFVETGQSLSDAQKVLFPVGETRGVRKDGSSFPVDLSASIIILDDQEVAIGIVRDITERKLAEDSLRTSLQEKEILLREVHHRVKNNLQIISSIFRLQSRRVDDDKLTALLDESQNRIQSIALLHDTLYRSEDLSHIDMDAYLHEIAGNLARSLDVDGRIDLQVQAQDVSLGLDYAIPCGLMVNEITTNAIKHAFPPEAETQQPQVRIEMVKNARQHVVLSIADNGKGMPEGIKLDESTSLGLKLVHTLCGQLDGDIKILNGQGTTFILSFDGMETLQS